MANLLDMIWSGDKLGRRGEAAVLERFLAEEATTLRRLGRDQSFVLALDAQYGEGKSWFLDRFRKQLEINHPVAFVDAWVDDANHEPLVSIIATLEDAMRPFFKKRGVKEKFGAVSRAALPIIGKAALGAGGKLVARYIGDEFGGFTTDAVATASAAKLPHPIGGDKSAESEAALAAANAFTEGVSEIVDSAGKAMLDQYRVRQKSRQAFKRSLATLAASIDGSSGDARVSPIFVIVDELDRCRPSYAIALLEEIKHLFDVPGVVFVVALHGEQLIHSINSIYGAGFDSRAYLRRFFTRTYGLRRLSIRELVVSHFSQLPRDAPLSSAQVFDGPAVTDADPAELAGDLLTEWLATPREAQAVVDGLRLFVSNWDYDVAIELPLVLLLLLNLIRNDPLEYSLPKLGPRVVKFAVSAPRASGYRNPPAIAGSSEFWTNYEAAAATELPDFGRNGMEYGVQGYINSRMSQEMAKLHNSSYQTTRPPKSVWGEYREKVKELGRFVAHDAPDANDDAG